MKYKLTEKGNIIIGTNGHPVVIDDDGKEITVDAIGAQTKIVDLSRENKDYRTKASGYKKDLEKFADIEDPAAAIQALHTVESMGDDHKVEVETLKKTLNKAWEDKIADRDNELSTVKGQLFDVKVLSKFATSDVIKKTVLTPDIAATFFKGHFNEDGTANDAAGNLIRSKENPAEPAEFDEAISYIIDNYPNKDSIMKGTGASGSGSDGAGHGGHGDPSPVSSVDAIKAGLAERGI